MNARKITVASNKTGDYLTIREAYESILPDETATIYVKNGYYFEKLIFSKPNITLIGEDKDKTVIVFNDSAKRLDEKFQIYDTFKTATLQVTPEAENFTMENITVANSAGYGKIYGQAVALYLDADKSVIKNCRLTGYQDTLLTAPYFKDINENPDVLRRQYFENCYIEGDVDFIFGGAVVYFYNCEIYSKKRPDNYNGYITAACTSEKSEFGYVFKNCRLTGDADENSVFLGRPWRGFAKTVFIECNFGKHIHTEHFSPWYRDNPDDRINTCYYAQYKNAGENYNEDTHINWSHILTDEQAEKYSTENVFGGWKPNRE